MPLGAYRLGKIEQIPRPIPPALAHEQGGLALIRNAWPGRVRGNPASSDNAAKYIREYAKRSGPMNDQYVRVGIVVTLGKKVIYGTVPDAPPTEISGNPSDWNGFAARTLLWYARNALNPHYNIKHGRNVWHDDGAISLWTPDEYLCASKLEESHAFYKYGHYMITAEQGGVLGWLYGKTNPPRMGPRYHGQDWLQGLQNVCDGTRTRPLHALLLVYRLSNVYGEAFKDVLRAYFKRQVFEEPPVAATYLPELDEEGKRVRMHDFAAEDLLDRMLKSDSPFVRTDPEPYPFHDKPLVIVSVPLSRVIYGYGDKFVPKAVLRRYYEHWSKQLSIDLGPDVWPGTDLDSD